MGFFSHCVHPDQIKPGNHVYVWRVLFSYAHHGIYVGENMVIHFNPSRTAGSGSSKSLFFGCPSCENSSGRLRSCDHEGTYPCGSEYSARSGVKVSCLKCFIGNCGSLYVYQYGVSKFVHGCKRGGTCTIAPSDPPKDVIDRATYLLRNGFKPYNVVRNNCEDFALYCKTSLLVINGKTTGSSGQVNTFTPMLAMLPTWAAGTSYIIFGLEVIMAFIAESTALGIATVLPAAKLLGAFVVIAGAAAIVVTHFKMRNANDIGVRGDAIKTNVEDVSLGP